MLPVTSCRQVEVDDGNSSTLRLLSVEREDGGMYFCQVSSVYGMANSTDSTVHISGKWCIGQWEMGMTLS